MAKNHLSEDDFRKMLLDDGFRVLEIRKGSHGAFTAIVQRPHWPAQRYEYRP